MIETKRDPRRHPKPGDRLLHPKRKTLREVTSVDEDGRIVHYVIHSDAGPRHMRCWGSDWEKWCRNQKIEVVDTGGKDGRT